MIGKYLLLLLPLSLLLTAGNCVPRESLIMESNPSQQYLDIKGTIDESMEYVISVMYVKNAKKSGCPTFGEDSDICQVKPETFRYTPELIDGRHSLHLPLKELSPGPNSWWEPRDISICVGPKDHKTEPRLCQVLFSVTKDRHDGNHKLHVICSQRFECYHGLQVEHVSQMNREYVVNIGFASDTQGPTTTTLLRDLLNRGRMAEYLDRVLSNINQWHSPTLLTASQIAMREDRINEGLLLYHAGTIRFRVDQDHYQPMDKAMRSFFPPLHLLRFPMQYEMSILTADELTNTYTTIVPLLEEWNPNYDRSYQPGWKHNTQPDPKQLLSELNTIKSKRVQVLRKLITLFKDQTYANAHSIVQAYERDLLLDQQTREKLEAEETMRRIEALHGIEGYMAAITKDRERRQETACLGSSEDVKNIECATKHTHQ